MLCGGTGFYARAAIDGYEFPEGEQVGNPIRDRFNEIAETRGADYLWGLLRDRDPKSAETIPPRDVKRVVRGISSLLEDATSYAAQKERLASIPQVVPAIFIGLAVDPDRLRARIDARVDAMFEQGLVREVESLLNAGFQGCALTAPQAIGYKEVVAALDGNITTQRGPREDQDRHAPLRSAQTPAHDGSARTRAHRLDRRQRRRSGCVDRAGSDDCPERVLTPEPGIASRLPHCRTTAVPDARIEGRRMEYRFAKLHGLGNDFIFIEDWVSLDRVLIGCGGMSLRSPHGDRRGRHHPRPSLGAPRMHRLYALHQLRWNARADAGNGVRCFAKYLIDRRLVDVSSGSLVADTLAGPKPIAFTLDDEGRMAAATVDMGTPTLDPALIPVFTDVCGTMTDDGASCAIATLASPWARSPSHACRWTRTPCASWSLSTGFPMGCSRIREINPSTPSTSPRSASSSRIARFRRRRTSSSSKSRLANCACASSNAPAGDARLRNRRMRRRGRRGAHGTGSARDRRDAARRHPPYRVDGRWACDDDRAGAAVLHRNVHIAAGVMRSSVRPSSACLPRPLHRAPMTKNTVHE